MLKTLVFGLFVAGVACSLAAAQEAPMYRAGDTARVAGTMVSCAVGATSVTCSKQGGLSAKLDTSGRVQITKGASVLFSRSASEASGHHLLGPNGGFIASGLYCHVYVQGARIISCYKEPTPKGGAKGSYGFDISDVSVVVFHFPQTGVLQTTRTFAQP
jgi:hypothetical protein